MAATPTIPALLALFKIDRDRHQLQVGLDNVQREQRRQQAKIAELTKSLETQDTANKKQQADQNIREMELKTRQEHIDKLRVSLNSTKTNKEYSAILVQISAEKAEVSKMEASLLELMQVIETNNTAIATLKVQIEAEKAILAKIEAEHSGKVTALQQQIDALNARRAEATGGIATDAMRQYERISQKYPGDAMAPVDYDENDLDSVSCGACYMGLNMEHINALRGRGEIRRCDSCNRILYLREMLPQDWQPSSH